LSASCGNNRAIAASNVTYDSPFPSKSFVRLPSRVSSSALLLARVLSRWFHGRHVSGHSLGRDCLDDVSDAHVLVRLRLASVQISPPL